MLVPKKDKIAIEALGKSRGGLSTKIHATCDALGNSTAFHLTPGQSHDLEGADALLDQINAGSIIADKAYDADARMRDKITAKRCKAVIPPLRQRKVLIEY